MLVAILVLLEGPLIPLSPTLAPTCTPLTGRKSEAFSPMGSLRVAGITAGSALGAGVEVTTTGWGKTSSWRGPELCE